MSNSSNLNGPSSISPVLGGVWKIQKNRRPDDRKNRDNNKKYKDSEDSENRDIIDIKKPVKKQLLTPSDTEQKQSNPSMSDKVKQNPLKIDLVI